MEELRRSPVEVGSLFHYLQGFIHARWCKISSINSMDSYQSWYRVDGTDHLSRSIRRTKSVPKVFDPFGTQFAVSCTDVSRMMVFGFGVATPTCLFFNFLLSQDFALCRFPFNEEAWGHCNCRQHKSMKHKCKLTQTHAHAWLFFWYQICYMYDRTGTFQLTKNNFAVNVNTSSKKRPSPLKAWYCTVVLFRNV